MELFRNKKVRIVYNPENNVATAVYAAAGRRIPYMEAMSSLLDEMEQKDMSRWVDLFDKGPDVYPGLSVQAELIWTRKQSGRKVPSLGENKNIVDQLPLEQDRNRPGQQYGGIVEGVDNITNWRRSRD